MYYMYYLSKPCGVFLNDKFFNMLWLLNTKF